MTTTSGDLNLYMSAFITMKTSERSAVLQALETTNIVSGMNKPVFGNITSAAAFVEEAAAKATNSGSNRGVLTPQVIAEIYKTTKQAYSASKQLEYQKAINSFVKGFALAVDRAVLTGVGAPATGFGTFATSPSQAVDTLNGVDGAIETASEAGTVSAIIMSTALKTRILGLQRSTTSAPLVNEGNGVWNWDGIKVFISPISGVHGAVVTEGAVVVGATGTEVTVDMSATVDGDSAFQKNLVFIRSEGSVASVVLNQAGIVTLEGFTMPPPDEPSF